MKEFFVKNKTVLAILGGALIIGGTIYFFGEKSEVKQGDNEISIVR